MTVAAPPVKPASPLMKLVGGLNERQREAVTQPMESCLVLAGAGSGKTAVLTSRICWLLEKESVPPDRILAVTFTNKAAEEMRRRLRKIVGDEAVTKMWIGTFHSLCNRILRLEHEAADLPQSFAILDEDGQERIVRSIMKSRSKAADQAQRDEDEKTDDTPKKMVKAINEAKEAQRKPFDIDEDEEGLPFGLVDVFVEYEQVCRKQGLLDFNDLQTRTLELFQDQPDILALFQHKFKAIFVDEFQDTNEVQYRWLQQLGKDACVMAVGDDDQSIYGFRGAQPWNMQRFLNEFARGRKVALEQNYRSLPFVLDAANAVIARNTDRLGKKLFSVKPDNREQILCNVYDNEFEEARSIATTTKAMIDKGVKPKEIAVLYRTNSQSRVIEHEMLKLGIPITIYGGFRFYDRAEIKHVIAYMDLACNLTRDIAFSKVVNVPRRGIGERTTQELHDEAKAKNMSMVEVLAERQADREAMGASPDKREAALEGFLELILDMGERAQTMELGEFVEHVIHESGLYDYYAEDVKPTKKAKAGKEDEAARRIENLESMRENAESFYRDFLSEREKLGDRTPAGGWKAAHVLPDYLSEIALLSSTSDAAMTQKNTVSLMTVHSSKGLEFDNVFIAGLEQGTFPHKRSIPDSGEEPGSSLYQAKLKELEEERRLMYVAITRARQRLYVSRCTTKNAFGEKQAMQASVFLSEIPKARMAEKRVTSNRSNFRPAQRFSPRQ